MTCNPKTYCAACGHSRGKHYKDLDGVTRCNYQEHGTTSKGVIGLPYTVECDCVNLKVPKRDKSLEFPC